MLRLQLCAMLQASNVITFYKLQVLYAGSALLRLANNNTHYQQTCGSLLNTALLAVVYCCLQQVGDYLPRGCACKMHINPQSNLTRVARTLEAIAYKHIHIHTCIYP